MPNLHRTVLLKEAVRALITNRNGIYVDCTYGRGGHSRAIANERRPEGRVLLVDRDRTAIRHARTKFEGDPRFAALAHKSWPGHSAMDQGDQPPAPYRHRQNPYRQAVWGIKCGAAPKGQLLM